MFKERRKPGGRRGPAKEGEKKEFEEEVLQIDRVTRVVKGGRRLRFRATVVVGNRNGKVGLGLGKSHEVIGSIQKATYQAKKYLITVPLINGTLPHEVQVKFKSAKIWMKPASPGTGIIAGGSVRKILELVGVKNVLSKILGASNRITNAKAVMIALKQLKKIPAPAKPTEAKPTEENPKPQ